MTYFKAAGENLPGSYFDRRDIMLSYCFSYIILLICPARNWQGG